ncbi:hypothetical protein MJN51_35175, partial [Salmonella enterica subsp. enterica serovar Kentucky]|nr:hypothetical protein [Salmonella enterica subsp. enterica serovar Kentucky]
MMRNWGGQSIYFPKGISGRASERDYQIYSECDGRNYAELAKKSTALLPPDKFFFKCRTLTVLSGADTQSRTGDLTLTKGALYQL